MVVLVMVMWGGRFCCWLVCWCYYSMVVFVTTACVHMYAWVCDISPGQRDIFNVGVGVTVFVGVVLAVNGEAVDGRIISNICAINQSQK